tara:strand:- start:1618 stop:3381 length:1764 start_codon:yes stop_codon:yes gene_type:complete
MYEIIFNSTILIFTLISAGHFFSKIILQNNNQLEISHYGILGIIFLSIISFILNLIAPLNEMISNFIFIFIILNFFIIKFKNKLQITNFIKKIIPLILLNILLISYSNYYDPDGAWYHLPFSRLINDYKIILGSASLHPMFGSHSILQYFAASLHNSLTGPNGVLFVNSLIGAFFLMFFYEKYKLEKNFYLKIFLFMALVLFFIEMNRVSEYGNDTGGHLFFILTIFFSLKILLEKKLTPIAFKEICLLSLFTFFIKPLLIFILFIPAWLYIKNNLYKNFSFVPLFSVLITFFWLLKNTLLTGCLIYPLNFTCIEKLSWYSSNSNFLISAKNSSQFSELHSKGWKNFDQNIRKFVNYENELEKKENFKNSFKWVNSYIEGGYYNNILKKVDYYIIFLSLVFLILFYLSKKSRLRREKLFKKGDLKKINILLYLNLIFFFIFIIKFPDGRYGLSYMFVVIYFIFIYIFCYLNFNLRFLKLVKILNFFLIILFTVFLLKNSMKILIQNEIASPLPDINYKNSQIFKKMSKKIENGKILDIYYGDAKNIRFAEKNLCKYFKSPCIPNGKSIDDFIIEKKSDYLILKLKEN